MNNIFFFNSVMKFKNLLNVYQTSLKLIILICISFFNKKKKTSLLSQNSTDFKFFILLTISN